MNNSFGFLNKHLSGVLHDSTNSTICSIVTWNQTGQGSSPSLTIYKWYALPFSYKEVISLTSQLCLVQGEALNKSYIDGQDSALSVI